MTAIELICRELAKSSEPDPDVVARRVLPRLTKAQREEALLEGLLGMAHAQIIKARQEKREGRAPAKSGPSRWRVAMRERVYINGDGWKLLDDCTVDDLRWLAADYRMRAEQMEAKAVEFDRLADELEAAGGARVADLQKVAA